jgi:hypothetical protein
MEVIGYILAALFVGVATYITAPLEMHRFENRCQCKCSCHRKYSGHTGAR